MHTPRLCLVDGTFELFRAFFGAPSRFSSGGAEIGASVALARSLRALARDGDFTHFAVAFDTVIESFRNDLFDGYKSGEGIAPELFSQFALAERVTSALGFVVFGMIEFEADDALASAAAQLRDRPELAEIVIASPDKDLRQCVGPKVRTWDRMRDVYYDEAGVIEKMGVPPHLVADYLALVGDSADGIPGVPRFGERSASAVLSHFGHLEAIPRDLEKWDLKIRGAKSLLEQLRAHEEEVLLYRRLATLREDVELGVGLEELEYKGPNQAALEQLSLELGVNL
jgi:5'-3' exonuclease